MDLQAALLIVLALAALCACWRVSRNEWLDKRSKQLTGDYNV